MNTIWTSRIVHSNGVRTLKADMTKKAPEIDRLLAELGNEKLFIPFYAVYPADGRSPITLKGPITQWKIGKVLAEAGPSRDTGRVASATP